LLKESPIFFNEFIVELFEDFMYKHIGSFFDSEKSNKDAFFNMIVVCYEIFTSNIYM